MKKTKILTVVGALLAMSVTACGGTNNQPSGSGSNPSSPTSEPSSEPTSAPTSETTSEVKPDPSSSSSSSSSVHEHTFATEWSSDATSHWHAATCEHTDVKGNEAEHTKGDWTVKTAATATADGVEARNCTVCNYELETRPIYHVEIAVKYPFASSTDYTVSNNADGSINFAVKGKDNGGADAYSGQYVSMSSIKVELATAYTFVFKNNGTNRAQIRMAFRNTTVDPRTYAQSTNVEDYTIESLNNRSNTKIEEYRSDYIRFRVEKDDTAKFTVPLVNNIYDQFALMLVHDTVDLNIDLIQTQAIVGEHNFETGYQSDDNYHWKNCTDEGCDFITGKAAHDWVKDESKTDVPATSEADGVEYKVCSVCGKTKEIIIPAGGSSVDEENDISNSAYVKSYNATDLGITEGVHSQNSVKSRAIQYNNEQDTGRFNFQGLFQDLTGKKLVFDVKVGEGALSNTYLKLDLRTGESNRYEISLRMSDKPAGVTCTALTGSYADWSHYEIDVDTAVAGKTPTSKTGAGEYGFVGAHVSNTTFYFDNMYVTALA